MEVAATDLYMRRRDRVEPILYCRAGDSLAKGQFFTPTDTGVRYLYVQADDFRGFGAKLLGSIESFIKCENIPVADRFGMLQLAASLEIDSAARTLDCGRFVALAQDVGRQIVDLLSDSDVLPHDLFRIARHDFSTFTHVTNVSCFAVVLIDRLGYCQQKDVDRVATGAMLHDVGKRFISTEILTKRGRLDQRERDLVEEHPLRGYEQLYGRPGIDFDQLMMVYQHHERQNGSGYPVRILADEIHPWAQALAVVDVFEAMTGNRPYRRPAKVHDVLDYLDEHAGSHFNPEVVKCWVSAMRET